MPRSPTPQSPAISCRCAAGAISATLKSGRSASGGEEVKNIPRGLLATFNGTRRVWLDLFDKVRPDEHAMAHTTPRTAEKKRRRCATSSKPW